MKDIEKGRIRDALILFKDGNMNLDEVITLIGEICERTRNNQTDANPKQTTTCAVCESHDAKSYEKGNTSEDSETSVKDRMNDESLHTAED